jgi:non-lysosomal glucosylceramidase
MNRQVDRRDFLRIVGLGTAASIAPGGMAMAGPFQGSDYDRLVPADKKLTKEWVASLFAKGEPAVYRGKELDLIGMPIGGLCAGQIYLGGDGRLWHWDIFNQPIGTGDGNYAHPPKPESPVEQGFSISTTARGKTETRTLDRQGFSDVTFLGEYPIGTVVYRDPTCPVVVTLEAFSPFVPLNTEDSTLPATILGFTVHNTSAETVSVSLMGSLENGVLLNNRALAGTRRNRIVREKGITLLECSAEKPSGPQPAARPDVLFEDWHTETYDGWTAEGTAFGKGPIHESQAPSYQGDLGGDSERVVNSHATAPGGDVGAKDSATGTLTSRAFTLERGFIHFWIGGGAHEGRTCINMVVDGKVVGSATGRNENRMHRASFDVRRFAGKQAMIQIVDRETGGWGNIGVGSIVFSDRPLVTGPLEEMPDFGTIALALLGRPAEHAAPSAGPNGQAYRVPAEATGDLDDSLIGALGRNASLAPGKSMSVDFVLAWHFPNLELGGMGKVGRHYANRFDSAGAVARYAASHFRRLTAETRLWRDTWYRSSLPRWFLDRTLLNTSILATSTAYRFKNGRFYGWEGVGCCAGTCAHVWHYAHAPARLFPELERTAREMADYGAGFDADTGRIRFRAEHNDHWAVDGQAGCILRAYREHQMTADDAFLRRLWPRVKKSLEFLISKDPDRDGIIDGPQHNTLDADWFGQVAWLSSLYVAALRAGEAMAREMGDESFAVTARRIADAGAKSLDSRLFNGEYYVQLPDPANAKSVGSYDGCEIDQVFGQSWAHQVGLGRIQSESQVRTALQALWKCNFAPDVGPWRAAHKPGRWYAMPGEAGLLMCGWPRGEKSRVGQDFDFYFNECMTGFEYQAAGHMLWEGMLTEGLAVTRAIHDRYHPSRRNPWNEVECGDHYARAMASYGVFLAACGFEHHGPKGHLAFAPRLNPENFQAAFTTAEGWGSYSQQATPKRFRAEVAVKWGKLRLKTLAFELAKGASLKQTVVRHGGRELAATSTITGRRLEITLGEAITIQAGSALTASVG